MSKRCPECRFVNEDSRIFCASCGAALDANIRLIQGLERQARECSQQEDLPRQRRDIKFYTPHKAAPPKKEKRSVLPWVLLLLAVGAAALWFFLK